MHTLIENVKAGNAIYFPEAGTIMNVDSVQFGYGSRTGVYLEGTNQIGQEISHLGHVGDEVIVWM